MDARLLTEFERICGPGAVLHEPLELLTYECDGLPHLRKSPALVVLPGSAAEVQAVVRLCGREGLPFVARGHGTGLSGGALPVEGGVVIGLARRMTSTYNPRLIREGSRSCGSTTISQ